MSIIEISIPNWTKFNPRQDRANFTWFRFQNDFFQDQKMFGATDGQVVLYMICLCEASKKNTDTFDLNLEYVAAIRKTTTAKILSDLKHLADRAVIKPALCRLDAGSEPADRRDDVACETANSLATNVRTYERTDVVSANADTPQSRKKSAPGRTTYAMETKSDFTALLGAYLTAWSELYPDREYLNREVGKGLLWLKSNPQKNRKTPRGWAQFWSGWFDRGWDKSRTRGTSVQTSGHEWEQAALLVKSVLRSHGTGTRDQEEIKIKLGEIYPIAAKVGIHLLRQVKEDGFYVKNVSEMLKGASEMMTAEEETTDGLRALP